MLFSRLWPNFERKICKFENFAQSVSGNAWKRGRKENRATENPLVKTRAAFHHWRAIFHPQKSEDGSRSGHEIVSSKCRSHSALPELFNIVANWIFGEKENLGELRIINGYSTLLVTAFSAKTIYFSTGEIRFNRYIYNIISSIFGSWKSLPIRFDVFSIPLKKKICEHFFVVLTFFREGAVLGFVFFSRRIHFLGFILQVEFSFGVGNFICTFIIEILFKRGLQMAF